MGIERYLDNAATTRPYERAIAAAQEAFSAYYNPSAVYKQAVEISKRIEEIRKKARASIGAKQGTILYTSGGTESINTALNHALRKGQSLVTTSYEHAATIQACEALERDGHRVHYVEPVDGRIRIEDIIACVDDTIGLVSVMHVNNEVGNIVDVQALGKAIKKKNPRILFHVDAVQSYLKLKIDVEAAMIDLMSISAHKIHGIKGTGALYVRHPERLRTLIHGGGQEQNLRSGTENVPGIFAFGAALEAGHEALERHTEHLQTLRARFLELLSASEIKDVVVNSPEDGAPHILNISFLGVPSEILLHSLEARGIMVSSGSACSAKKKASRTLEALGLPAEVRQSAIRISFGYWNREAELGDVIAEIESCVKQIRSITKYQRKKDLNV